MTEAKLQAQVCKWIRMQYPHLIFTSEASGQRMTIGQARKAKLLRSGNKLPDLIILQPRGNWHGMALELKVVSPFKKDGTLKKDEHLEGQEAMLLRLFNLGYYANFSTGFDETINHINHYMNL
jgi:hypothetical protein